MAEMTQEMYGATGKVGNKVYYRSGGKTVAREVVTPKNPKTTAQTVQRVIASQVAKDYQKFKDLCDHAFEGVTNGFECMNRFKKLNMRHIRERAAEIQQSGNSLAQYYNFQPVGSTKWVPDATILSQGQLPRIYPTIGDDGLGLSVGKVAVTTNTYEGVCAALNLKRGDQLTFVCVVKTQYGEYEVHKARIILDPRNQDGSGAAMTSAFISGNAVVNPSRRNSGSFATLDFNGGIEFSMGANGDSVVGVAVIASRKDGDEWLRSNSQLVISEAGIGSDLCGLWTAVESSYQSSDIDVDSEYYLNNAGQGGAQGTSTPAEPSTDPVYSNSVALNGTSQNISGGSVNVTAPLTTIGITGQNLATAPVKAKKVGSDTEYLPSTQTATMIGFTNLNIAAGESLQVLRNNVVWFTVSAIESSGGSDAD